MKLYVISSCHIIHFHKIEYAIPYVEVIDLKKNEPTNMLKLSVGFLDSEAICESLYPVIVGFLDSWSIYVSLNTVVVKGFLWSDLFYAIQVPNVGNFLIGIHNWTSETGEESGGNLEREDAGNLLGKTSFVLQFPCIEIAA